MELALFLLKIYSLQLNFFSKTIAPFHDDFWYALNLILASFYLCQFSDGQKSVTKKVSFLHQTQAFFISTSLVTQNEAIPFYF
jgi:hypothetical protein